MQQNVLNRVSFRRYDHMCTFSFTNATINPSSQLIPIKKFAFLKIVYNLEINIFGNFCWI